MLGQVLKKQERNGNIGKVLKKTGKKWQYREST